MVGEGLRPLAGATTPAPLQRLLDDCWQSDRAARPTAQQLVVALQQMLVRCDHRCVPRVVLLHGSHCKIIPGSCCLVTGVLKRLLYSTMRDTWLRMLMTTLSRQ